jgi:glycosyltransferase involved in cell wall biosynthesis
MVGVMRGEVPSAVPKLRVCIDARLPDGTAGGIQQVVIGLAAGLAALDQGPEEYLFLVRGEVPAWLAPHLVGPCRALVAPGEATWKRAIRAVIPHAWIQGTWNRLSELRPAQIPESDGTVERAGVDVMHQTLQLGFRTRIPCIYTPYDLQHLHLPEGFKPQEIRWRSEAYASLCRQAEFVLALSRWGKADLVEKLQLPPEKVKWVHMGPAVDAYAPVSDSDVSEVRERYALPAAFAYYPAQTWIHKNHLGLVEALARLRDRDGMTVPLVSTGHMNDFYPTIERRVHELGLDETVRFLGFVPTRVVQVLYRLCRIMVFPSRFEGFGLPVVEAFRLGAPVACSSAASLPEVAADAALLFDPDRSDAIADAVLRLWTDEVLRKEIISRGKRRVADFSWRETARRLRALYRLLGRRHLEPDDHRAVEEMS